ncbi:hypothetical protein EN858_17370 [Mesorhizobium sp. M4B.F.Ca.ET.215.01.1.1]|uniref:hypothetical protein n=1 Tax=unclassified Mesorhizobium TaxID=325217 RepID=UPI000FCC80AA|nr:MULTISPECIES: hypothetical protein [unclassified Mesorhizobium]RUW65865.1 hypothetical protein EOA31_32690 [Mesorhizobium sp. M4B.F.Ca.ET.049.02.1.2]RVC79231.1 hypothetical protein EN745_16565 [Mesorhizobium sp. M4A.F.Ca.ET.022.05.2.1]TGQ10185.1 hypothetical protein EN858_17370 [Mesorhizobium sp. M4B.F.Ca.ET.215.01.1.1]TGQ34022.1 hypothetical protein EN863_033540 [Mesorhizobium sp. M00.F.Ca.ET.220.01.1.1]TGR02724.1 hypothetical protein EN846_16820 [Mesorhizobium sp. M4B.F.Ca.ET.203.01.1.1]
MNAPVAFGKNVRRAVEDEIERLIALLDLMEPDADLEPWLAGGIEVVGTDDREQDNSDIEEGGDSERSLGWPEPCSQGRDEWERQRIPYIAGSDSND